MYYCQAQVFKGTKTAKNTGGICDLFLIAHKLTGTLNFGLYIRLKKPTSMLCVYISR